jgi:transposase
MGRPGLPPGIYFRLLLIGYFEGIDSERGIAWRAADSLALRDFIGVSLEDTPPDHSTISRTRRLIDLETHRAVFTWVLQWLSMAGLVKGKTVGIDAPTLEANAALRSIVRRDTGEGYEEFLTRLAKASGISTPTRADLARIDRKPKKKGSNDDWMHPHDPDAKIAAVRRQRISAASATLTVTAAPRRSHQRRGFGGTQRSGSCCSRPADVTGTASGSCASPSNMPRMPCARCVRP